MIMSPQEMREEVELRKRKNVNNLVLEMIDKMMTELRFKAEIAITCVTLEDAYEAKAQSILLLNKLTEKGWIVEFSIDDYQTESGLVRYYLGILVREK